VDPLNPLVVLEFPDGSKSLFDLRKGLILNPPAGPNLPSRDSLRAFAALLQKLRISVSSSSAAQVEGVLEDSTEIHFSPFEVVS
jgi:hypothetical protein